jgi:hypothetical protein
MTAKYEHSGIRFLYPENWEIAEDQTNKETRSVLVQAPSGAFWSVDLCIQALNPRGLAEQVLETMEREYSDLEAEEVTDQIGGQDASGYDMQFYCMDLVVTARVRTVCTNAGTLVLLCQAEDREFQRLEPVFRAMSESVFQESRI